MARKKKMVGINFMSHEFNLKDVRIGIHSEETADFIADLTMDGEVIGRASNDGHGGCTMFYFADLGSERIAELRTLEESLRGAVRFVYNGKNYHYLGFGELAEEILFRNYSEKEIWRF
jgi:hypothetical protein